jgi:ATP-dependent Clp protease protease subunit
MKELINQIIAQHTGQDFSRIEQDTERGDFILTAPSAKDYGIIDEVISKK